MRGFGWVLLYLFQDGWTVGLGWGVSGVFLGGDSGLVGEGIWVGLFFFFFQDGWVGWDEGLHENFLLGVMEGDFGLSFRPYHSIGIGSFFKGLGCGGLGVVQTL